MWSRTTRIFTAASPTTPGSSRSPSTRTTPPRSQSPSSGRSSSASRDDCRELVADPGGKENEAFGSDCDVRPEPNGLAEVADELRHRGHELDGGRFRGHVDR